ncbi:MAG: hypothetical protein ACXVCV_20825 [Polyangia bacterium]
MKVALLLLASAAVGAGGCTTNDISLSIIQMEEVTRANMCVATATAGTGVVGLGRGTLDVSLVTTAGYIGVPVVRNNLVSLMNGVEYNAIQLQGANIKLTDASGNALTLPSGQSSFFYASAAGRLDPAGITPMFVEVLPAAAAKSLAGMIGATGVFTIIAEIRPVGSRGGSQVVGGPISFPIDLCNGCLAPMVTACPLAKGTVVTDPCFPQQDVPSVCCTDTTGARLCGAAAPVATM